MNLNPSKKGNKPIKVKGDTKPYILPYWGEIPQNALVPDLSGSDSDPNAPPIIEVDESSEEYFPVSEGEQEEEEPQVVVEEYPEFEFESEGEQEQWGPFEEYQKTEAEREKRRSSMVRIVEFDPWDLESYRETEYYPSSSLEDVAPDPSEQQLFDEALNLSDAAPFGAPLRPEQLKQIERLEKLEKKAQEERLEQLKLIQEAEERERLEQLVEVEGGMGFVKRGKLEMEEEGYSPPPPPPSPQGPEGVETTERASDVSSTQFYEEIKDYTLVSDYTTPKKTFDFWKTVAIPSKIVPERLEENQKYRELPEWLKLVVAVALNNEDMIVSIMKKTTRDIFAEKYSLVRLSDKKIGMDALKTAALTGTSDLLTAANAFAGTFDSKNPSKALDPKGLPLFEFCLGSYNFERAETLFKCGARIADPSLQESSGSTEGVSTFLMNIGFDSGRWTNNNRVIKWSDPEFNYAFLTYKEALEYYNVNDLPYLYSRYTTFSTLHRLTNSKVIAHVFANCLAFGDFLGAFIILNTSMPEKKKGMYFRLPYAWNRNAQTMRYLPATKLRLFSWNQTDLFSILTDNAEETEYPVDIDTNQLLKFANELVGAEVKKMQSMMSKMDKPTHEFLNSSGAPKEGGNMFVEPFETSKYPTKADFLDYFFRNPIGDLKDPESKYAEAFVTSDNYELFSRFFAYVKWDSEELRNAIKILLRKPLLSYESHMKLFFESPQTTGLVSEYFKKGYFYTLESVIGITNITTLDRESFLSFLKACPAINHPTITQTFITRSLESARDVVSMLIIRPRGSFENCVRQLMSSASSDPKAERIILETSLIEFAKFAETAFLFLSKNSAGDLIECLRVLFVMLSQNTSPNDTYGPEHTSSIVRIIVKALRENSATPASDDAATIFAILRKNKWVTDQVATEACEQLVTRSRNDSPGLEFAEVIKNLAVPTEESRAKIVKQAVDESKWTLVGYWIQTPFARNFNSLTTEDLVNFMEFSFKHFKPETFARVMNFVTKRVSERTDPPPKQVYELMLTAAFDAEEQIRKRQWFQERSTLPLNIMKQWDREKLARVWAEVMDVLPPWIVHEPVDSLKKIELFINTTGLNSGETMYWNVLYCTAIIAIDVEKVSYYYDTFKDTYKVVQKKNFKNRCTLVSQGLMAATKFLCIPAYSIGQLPEGASTSKLLLKEGSTTEFDTRKRGVLAGVLGKHINAAIKEEDQIKMKGAAYVALLCRDFGMYSFLMRYIKTDYKDRLFPWDYPKRSYIPIGSLIFNDDDVRLLTWFEAENPTIKPRDDFDALLDNLLRGKRQVLDYLIKTDDKTKMAENFVKSFWKRIDKPEPISNKQLDLYIKRMIGLVRELLTSEQEISRVLAIFSDHIDKALSQNSALPLLLTLDPQTADELIKYCQSFPGCGPLVDIWARVSIYKFGTVINWTSTLEVCFEHRDISLAVLLVSRKVPHIESAVLSALRKLDPIDRTPIREKMEAFAPDTFYRLDFLDALSNRDLERAKTALEKGAPVEMNEIEPLLISRWRDFDTPSSTRGYPLYVRTVLEKALSDTRGIPVPRRRKTEADE